MSRRRGRHSDGTAGRPGLLRLLGGAVAVAWKADRTGFVIAAVLQLVGALSPTVLVVLGQYLLNHLAGKHPTMHEALPPVLALAIASSVTTAAAAFQQQQQRLLGERTAAEVWERVLDVSTRVPLERYESPEFFDQLQRIRNNALTRPIAVITSLFGMLGSVVGLISLLTVVASIAPLLVPMMLVAAAPSLLLARRVSRLEFAFLTSATPIYRARQYLRDVLSNRDPAKEIRVFGAERLLRDRHRERRVQYDRLLAAHTRRRLRLAAVGVLLSSLLLGATLLYVVHLLVDGHLQLGSAAAAILAVRFLALALQQLLDGIGQLFESTTYLADLADFVDRENAEPAPTVDGRTPELEPLQVAIDLRQLSFAYPDAPRSALSDIDLTIGAGQVVALVGENGSGKTTLAKLVAGLYRPTAGSIAWDGVPYAAVARDAVHRHVAAIFQDFVRYQLPARDNVGIGAPDEFDEDAIRTAAAQGGALAFLDKLPHGLDTVLSREFENGTDLSGGQWQRVAISRALRKQASLVVLDEPTAALDPRAEADLFAQIRATLDGRAGLLVSHRFSSVKLADHIYVLAEGRIVEHGTHDALMARDGLYAELFTLQADAYLDAGERADRRTAG